MSDHAPRCPFCANVLKLQPSFWERIGLRASKIRCPTCQRTCEMRDAHTMGAAYWHWAEMFRGELIAAINQLPILSEPAMHRALGMPHKDDTRLMPSVDELVRTCLRHQRAALIEMAKGREASLEVVFLNNETSGKPEVVAVVGATSAESGGREGEQLIVRHGMAHFVLYNYPGKEGAEPRVKRAIHEKGATPRALTDVHVAGMHAPPVGHAAH